MREEAAGCALEILPTAGALVRIRDWRWRVRRRHAHGRSVRLDLAAAEPGAPPLRSLLAPFDRCETDAPPSRLRRAAPGAFTGLLASADAAWPEARLAEAAALPIDLLPYQLAPALAVLDGAGARILIADEVGLGKTVQAGTILLALGARGLADRVLVLVPAGLRDQWREELTRLRLAPAVVDAAALRTRAASLPPGTNPWRPPGLYVTSLEFARQIDVLSGLAAICWDAVVIDEAHHAAGDSARAAAARLLLGRARLVVLLTATPHGGDPRAFASLCALGRTGAPGSDPLLWFRRTRAVRGAVPSRRVRVRRVAPSPQERLMHRRLDAYARSVERGGTPAARLAMLVLRKRALSSPAALLASLVHRLACLAGDQPHAQLALPLDDGEERGLAPALAAAGPGSPAQERDRLEAVIDAAKRAVPHTSKVERVARLCSGTREPLILFTEYRDTLDAIARRLGTASVTVLHGGLDREERREALSRFLHGRTQVLLATDAAGEGLNLQRASRLVVHYELPWSPVRLEQRVGRVDRMGQARRVHVWHLLGRRGHEEHVLQRLSRRALHIRGALGGEFQFLAPELTGPDEPGAAPDPAPVPDLVQADDEQAAEREVRILEMVRRLLARRPASQHLGRRRAVPVVRLRPRHRALSPGLVLLFAEPAGGFDPRERLVALHVALAGTPVPLLPRLRAVLSVLEPQLPQTADFEGEGALRRRLLARERALLAGLATREPLWQPALFDRRAAQAAAAARDGLEAERRRHHDRLALLGARGTGPHRRLLGVLVLE